MASRSELICDACVDEGKDEDQAEDGYATYLGFAQQWWILDLCEKHQESLLGELVALLDTVGAPVQGPPLNVPGVK